MQRRKITKEGPTVLITTTVNRLSGDQRRDRARLPCPQCARCPGGSASSRAAEGLWVLAALALGIVAA